MAYCTLGSPEGPPENTLVRALSSLQEPVVGSPMGSTIVQLALVSLGLWWLARVTKGIREDLRARKWLGPVLQIPGALLVLVVLIRVAHKAVTGP